MCKYQVSLKAKLNLKSQHKYLGRLPCHSYLLLTFKRTTNTKHGMSMQYLISCNSLVSITAPISTFYTNLEVVVHFQFQSLKNEEKTAIELQEKQIVFVYLVYICWICTQFGLIISLQFSDFVGFHTGDTWHLYNDKVRSLKLIFFEKRGLNLFNPELYNTYLHAYFHNNFHGWTLVRLVSFALGQFRNIMECKLNFKFGFDLLQAIGSETVLKSTTY